MKRTFLIALLLLVGMTLVFPQPGFSWGGPVVAVAAGALVGAVIAAPGGHGLPVAYDTFACIRVSGSGLWVWVSLRWTAVLCRP